jgi:hypothetical protein
MVGSTTAVMADGEEPGDDVAGGEMTLSASTVNVAAELRRRR